MYCICRYLCIPRSPFCLQEWSTSFFCPPLICLHFFFKTISIRQIPLSMSSWSFQKIVSTTSNVISIWFLSSLNHFPHSVGPFTKAISWPEKLDLLQRKFYFPLELNWMWPDLLLTKRPLLSTSLIRHLLYIGFLVDIGTCVSFPSQYSVFFRV